MLYGLFTPEWTAELKRDAELSERANLYGWRRSRSESMDHCFIDGDGKWRQFRDLDALEKALDEDRPRFIEREAKKARGA